MRNGKPTFRKGEEGFTLLEFALAMGLSAMVLFTIVSFYSNYTAKLNQMGDTAENASDIESGEQIMLKDLKAIEPSFGVLSLKDDLGRDFFEYYPDVPERDLDQDSVCGRPCRTYTMKQNGGFAEIVLIVHDHSAHPLPSLIYDPTWAETTHSCAPNCGTSPGAAPTWKAGGIYGGGVFDTTNTRGAITHLNGASLVIDYPGYWHNGQLLMLDTATGFRPNVVTDWAHTPPRPNFFIGLVQGTKGSASFNSLAVSAFDTKTISGSLDQQNLLITQHPVDPTLTISTAQIFLENLPAIGGGQPMVRMRPVRLVKYSIEPMYPTINPELPAPEQAKRKGALRVWRQLYINGAWAQNKGRSIIAENVKSVQFKRKTVTGKTVSFAISKYELKKGGESP